MSKDIEAFLAAYMKLNYSQFCVAINNREDDYAEHIWMQFGIAAQALNRLGTHVDKLVEAGSKLRA